MEEVLEVVQPAPHCASGDGQSAEDAQVLLPAGEKNGSPQAPEPAGGQDDAATSVEKNSDSAVVETAEIQEAHCKSSTEPPEGHSVGQEVVLLSDESSRASLPNPSGGITPGIATEKTSTSAADPPQATPDGDGKRLITHSKRERTKNFSPWKLPEGIRSVFLKFTPNEKAVFKEAYGFENIKFDDMIATVIKTRECLEMLSRGDKIPWPITENNPPMRITFLHMMFESLKHLPASIAPMYDKLQTNVQGQFRKLFFMGVPAEEALKAVETPESYTKKLASLGIERKPKAPRGSGTHQDPINPQGTSGSKTTLQKQDSSQSSKISEPKQEATVPNDIPQLYHNNFNPQNDLPPKWVKPYLDLPRRMKSKFRTLLFYKVPLGKIMHAINDFTLFNKLVDSGRQKRKQTKNIVTGEKNGRDKEKRNPDPHKAVGSSSNKSGRLRHGPWEPFSEMGKAVSSATTQRITSRDGSRHSQTSTVEAAFNQALERTKYLTSQLSQVAPVHLPFSTNPTDQQYPGIAGPSKTAKNAPPATEDLDSWSKSRIVYVSHALHPQELLTVTEMSFVRQNILDTILDVNPGQPKPSFFHSYSNRFSGQLVFYCNDDATVDWLRTYIPHCKPWPGACLTTIVDLSESSFTALATLPSCSEDDDNKILQYIAKQNENLNVSQWKILERQPNSYRTAILMTLLIDPQSAKILHENPQIDFKLGRASIKVIKGDSHNERLQNMALNEPKGSWGTSGGVISLAEEQFTKPSVPNQPKERKMLNPSFYGEAPSVWSEPVANQDRTDSGQYIEFSGRNSGFCDDPNMVLSSRSESQSDPRESLLKSHLGELSQIMSRRLSRSPVQDLWGRSELELEEEVYRPVTPPPPQFSPPLPKRSRPSVFQRLSNSRASDMHPQDDLNHSRHFREQAKYPRGNSRKGRERSPLPRSRSPLDSRLDRERSPHFQGVPPLFPSAGPKQSRGDVSHSRWDQDRSHHSRHPSPGSSMAEDPMVDHREHSSRTKRPRMSDLMSQYSEVLQVQSSQFSAYEDYLDSRPSSSQVSLGSHYPQQSRKIPNKSTDEYLYKGHSELTDGSSPRSSRSRKPEVDSFSIPRPRENPFVGAEYQHLLQCGPSREDDRLALSDWPNETKRQSSNVRDRRRMSRDRGRGSAQSSRYPY